MSSNCTPGGTDELHRGPEYPLRLSPTNSTSIPVSSNTSRAAASSGQLVRFYVSARREPHPELAMQVEKHLPVPHHEDRDRKMPARLLMSHGLQGTPGPPRVDDITECGGVS